MTNRDEYLNKLKAKLDEWDSDIDKLEAKSREVQADAAEQYRKQVESMRVMRDDAMTRFTEMQTAAADAWEAMMKGSENAWKTWLDAFEDARRKMMGGGGKG